MFYKKHHKNQYNPTNLYLGTKMPYQGQTVFYPIETFTRFVTFKP